jgi:hypothetical protein
MRGLSGWFDQVSTDGIKKTNRASNCFAGFSVPYFPAGETRTGNSRHDRRVSPFIGLSGRYFNRASFFDDPFSTIRAS